MNIWALAFSYGVAHPKDSIIPTIKADIWARMFPFNIRLPQARLGARIGRQQLNCCLSRLGMMPDYNSKTMSYPRKH